MLKKWISLIMQIAAILLLIVGGFFALVGGLNTSSDYLILSLACVMISKGLDAL